MYPFNTKSLGFHLTLLCTFFYTTRHTAQTSQPETAYTLGKSNKGFYKQHARAIHLTGAVLLLVFGSWGAYTVYRWRTFSKTEKQYEELTVHFISALTNQSLHTDKIKLEEGQMPTEAGDKSVYQMVHEIFPQYDDEDEDEDDISGELGTWTFYKAFISVNQTNNFSEDQYLYCKTNESMADYLSPYIGNSAVYIYVKLCEDLNTKPGEIILHHGNKEVTVEALGSKSLLDHVLAKNDLGTTHCLYTADAEINLKDTHPALTANFQVAISEYTVGQLFIDSDASDFLLKEDNTQKLHLYAYEEKEYNKVILYTSTNTKENVERQVWYVPLDKTVGDLFGDKRGIYLKKEDQIGWPTKEVFEKIINNNEKVFYSPKDLEHNFLKNVNIEDYLKRNVDKLNEVTFFING